jgi:hypothetical protein
MAHAAVCPYEAVAVRPSARTDAKTLRERKKRFEDIAILKVVRATDGSVLLQVPERVAPPDGFRADREGSLTKAA